MIAHVLELREFAAQLLCGLVLDYVSGPRGALADLVAVR